MKKKRAIVSVTNDLCTDQRVNKVCNFLHQHDFKVTLVGRKLKKSLEVTDRPYKTKRFHLFFNKKAFFYANYNIRLFWYLLFHKFDLLVSNDLDTLPANYLASRIKSSTRLVYDSHELFTEVPELTSRPKVRNVWLGIEKKIFPKLETVITVNPSIAEIYSKRYGLSLFVVRNVSPLWHPENIKSKQQLGLPDDKKIIILQGSGINVDRGGEEAVLAMNHLENTLLLFVGSGDVIPQLKNLVKENKLTSKVKFVDRLPYREMMNYTFHADIGLSLDKNTNPNYQFSLPNKVFDYIHTTTPIVCSNLIEIKRIIEKYDVGRIIPSHSPKAIAETISSIISNEDLLHQLKENCKKAAEFENWENETAVLKKIYLDGKTSITTQE